MRKAIGAALADSNFLPIPSKISFVVALCLQSTKSFLILKLSKFSKSSSTFFSSELVMASSDCCLLGYALCLSLPNRPAKAVQERALLLILQSKPLIVFCQMTSRGSNLDTLLPGSCLTNGFQRYYRCGIEFLFRSVENAKIEAR